MAALVPEGELIYGLQLPIQTLTETIREPWEVDASVEDLITIARKCEETGHSFVGACDHIAIPDNDYAAHMSTTWYDPIATLSYLAAATSSIRLLSTVFILPYRHPLMSAKSFMTLDHLSGGRAVMGIGAGHVEAEFQALGIDFSARGAMTNEAIDAIRASYQREHTSFTGDFYEYEDMGLGPRPVQDEIPIWVGGSSKPALRRVAERGDGWIPQGTPRAQMRDALDFIRRRRDEIRPGERLDLGFMPEWIYVGEAPDVFANHPFPHLTGPPDQIVESLREARDMGANVLHLHFRSRSLTEYLDQLDAFAAGVAPHL